MLFEIDQLSLTAIHPQLQPAVKLFQSSEPVLAMDQAFATIRNVPAEQHSPEDWMLLGNLAQACGLSARCRAAYAIGQRKFPQDARLTMLYGWELSARGQNQRFKRLLKASKPQNDLQRAYLMAVACYNHSINRWIQTAMKNHRSAIKLAGDDPVVQYILSRAAGRRTQWSLAIELGKRVVKRKPRWARAKAALFDSLLCVGKTKHAQKVLAASKEDVRHIWLDFSRATFLEVNRRHLDAIKYLKKLVNYYPEHSKTMKFCQRQLVLLLMKNDRIDDARRVMDRFSIKGFEEWQKLLTDDPRKAYVSIPMVAQTLDHCVPTVAAMAATAQGFTASPQKLAESMATRNGTPIWKMVDAMQELGFKTVCVKPEAAIIENMLEQGVPLIGELSGVFGGHVDVICGFNAALKLFHLRDPMHWYGFSQSYEGVEKRYESSCSLWALIPPDKIEHVQIDGTWINTAAQAYVDMSRAIAMGQRTVAEHQYQLIDDDHPLSFSRDCVARNVVLTSRQTEDRIKREVDSVSPDANMTLRQIRAMLSAMDFRNADHVYSIAKANQDKLGRTWVKFVHSQALLAKMKWRDAEKKLTEMTKLWPSTENLWSQLAAVKKELGKSQDAETCLRIALEISPEREYFQTKNVEQLKLKIPFDQQLKKQQEIEDRFPYSPELKFAKATLMADAADGLQYEAALKDCMRFFPRDVWAYEQLSGWYLTQNRKDFAAQILQEGRELVGEEDLPTSPWETEYWQEVSGQPKAKHDNEAEPITQPNISGATDSDANNQTAATDPPTTDTLAPDAQRLEQIRQWYSVVYEKSAELPYAEFQQLPELVSLKQADAGHEFNWQQSVSLLALQLRNLLFDQSEAFVTQADARVTAFGELLPQDVPGIPESFVDLLLEQVPLESASKRIVQAFYQWVDKTAPNSLAYPNLEFQKGYLLELMLQSTEAEQLLQRLVTHHPCFAIGWYRIGQLQMQRSDYHQAWETFKKCLAIQPGHYGALTELNRLAPVTSPQEQPKYASAISNLLPYSNHFLYEAAFALVPDGGRSAAIKMVEQRRAVIGDSACAVLIGRIHVDTENYQPAIDAIQKQKITTVDRYAADWVMIDSLVRLERFDQAQEILADLDQRHPDDENVMDQQARLLRRVAPQQAVTYSQNKIKAGSAMSVLMYIDVQNRPQPGRHATQMIDSLPDKHRDNAAKAYHHALVEVQQPQQLQLFLEHCAAKLPHLTSLRRALVSTLEMNQDTRRAIHTARELHEYEPENPKWLALLGWVVQDSDPRESIELLKKEFEISDSVDTLAQLGRGYQLAGDHQQAVTTYDQVLVRNPNHTVALTNMLYRYARDDSQILKMVTDTIAKSMVGDSDQYFLVQAVKLAIKHSRWLPPQWIDLAVGRLQQLEFEAPFGDEKKLLRRAIAAWHVRWKVPTTEFKVGFFEKLSAKFVWPKTKWVPDRSASQSRQ